MWSAILILACGSDPGSEDTAGAPLSPSEPVYLCSDGSVPLEVLPPPVETCSEDGFTFEVVAMVCPCDL